MSHTERIADGRRRFFAARGEVRDVLMRARKGHQDVGLERGRDYEIEAGGVSLRRVPSAGTVITILTGDRVREDGGPDAIPAEIISPGGAWASPHLPLASPASPLAATLPASQRITDGLSPVPVASGSAFPAAASADHSRDRPGPPATPSPMPIDLDRLKAALFASVHDTNDAFKDRTAAWQDGLAMLTAMMLAAPDYAATKAAMLEIEGYLGG